jgi:hypothetical protein
MAVSNSKGGKTARGIKIISFLFGWEWLFSLVIDT